MNDSNSDTKSFGNRKLPISAGITVPLSNSPTAILKTTGQPGPTASAAVQSRKNG